MEAGPDYPDFEQYPDDLKFGYDQTASAIDAPHNWSFQGNTTPLQTEPMPVPRGRVVGGSSAINGQVLLRGIPEDYDAWAALGNDQWGFTDCLPYLRKLETDMGLRGRRLSQLRGPHPGAPLRARDLAAGPAGVLRRSPVGGSRPTTPT